MKAVSLIFPNQLFRSGPLLDNDNEIYLIEEHLFFKQYLFHKQKIAFHRASMKAYEQFLKGINKTVHYIDADSELADIRRFEKEVLEKGIKVIDLIEPTDNWLEQRLNLLSAKCELLIHQNRLYLNNKESLSSAFLNISIASR